MIRFFSNGRRFDNACVSCQERLTEGELYSLAMRSHRGREKEILFDRCTHCRISGETRLSMLRRLKVALAHPKAAQ